MFEIKSQIRIKREREREREKERKQKQALKVFTHNWHNIENYVKFVSTICDIQQQIESYFPKMGQ